MTTFNERLKYLLQKNGVSQAELSAALNISAARLNQYFQGKAGPPYTVLAGLATFFNTSADYLLGRQISHICKRTPCDEHFFATNDDSFFLTQKNNNHAPIIERNDIVQAKKGNNLNKPYVLILKNGYFTVIKRENCQNYPIEAEIIAVIKSFQADGLNSSKDRLKYLLKAKNLRQADIAKVLDLSPARFSSYTTRNAEANNSLLCLMADVLGTSVDYLIGISDDADVIKNKKNICPKYGGISSKTGQMLIDIPIFNSGTNKKNVGYFRCGGKMRAVHQTPYCIKINDNSMEPLCQKNDLAIIAPRTYISPVMNNLDPCKLYAVRLNDDDHIGLSVRFCLTKDNIIFLRPSNLSFPTLGYNLGELTNPPATGIVAHIIREL